MLQHIDAFLNFARCNDWRAYNMCDLLRGHGVLVQNLQQHLGARRSLWFRMSSMQTNDEGGPNRASNRKSNVGSNGGPSRGSNRGANLGPKTFQWTNNTGQIRSTIRSTTRFHYSLRYPPKHFFVSIRSLTTGLPTAGGYKALCIVSHPLHSLQAQLLFVSQDHEMLPNIHGSRFSCRDRDGLPRERKE